MSNSTLSTNHLSKEILENVNPDPKFQDHKNVMLKICENMVQRLEDVGLEFARCRESCTTFESDSVPSFDTESERICISDVKFLHVIFRTCITDHLQDFWILLDTLKCVTSQFEQKLKVVSNDISSSCGEKTENLESIQFETPILKKKITGLTEKIEEQNRSFENHVAEKYKKIEELKRIKALSEASLKDVVNEIV